MGGCGSKGPADGRGVEVVLEGKGGSVVGAMNVLRGAKVECRVAEGSCLMRAGRAAGATEALRDLLLEVGGCACGMGGLEPCERGGSSFFAVA